MYAWFFLQGKLFLLLDVLDEERAHSATFYSRRSDSKLKIQKNQELLDGEVHCLPPTRCSMEQLKTEKRVWSLYMIIDTPGYLASHLRTDENQDVDTSEDDEMVLTEFSHALMCAKEGIDAIFVTLKAGDRVSLYRRRVFDEFH